MFAGHPNLVQPIAAPARAGRIARIEAPIGTERFRLLCDQMLIMALAFAVTAAPILLHLVSPPLATLVCLGSAVWIALRFDRAAPTVLIVAYTFQTTFVALASGSVRDSADLDAMKIYDFLTSIGIWAVIAARFLLDYRAVSPFGRRLILLTSCILVLAGVYFVAGLPIDARGSTIYMRNIGLPILLFQVCYFVSARHEFALATTVTILLAMLVCCGYFELLFVGRWLDLTNGWSYWQISAGDKLHGVAAVKNARDTGIVIAGIVDLMRSNFLNTNLTGDLAFSVTRLQGPNFHPISFGYVLAVLMAVSVVHNRLLMPLLAFPLLLCASAKGAIILLLVSVAFCLAARVYRGSLLIAGLALTLGLYALFAFSSGVASGDYHVLGLLGGLKGFVANPIGHTLGEGGNLSTAFAGIDWTAYQHAGATDVAVESGIGVMLYQMGLATLPVVLIYLWLSATAWRLYGRLRAPCSCAVLRLHRGDPGKRNFPGGGAFRAFGARPHHGHRGPDFRLHRPPPRARCEPARPRRSRGSAVNRA